MKNILIALLFISSSASAQWKPNGTVQRWNVTIHLKDSVTGKPKPSIPGLVKVTFKVYWDKGKIDPSRGIDKEQKELLGGGKSFRWSEYDRIEFDEPGTKKHIVR